MQTYGYVTLDYVDEYLNIYYPRLDSLACHFKVLSDEDKIAWLMSSAYAINNLVMQGCRVDKNQEFAFPRKECFKPYIIPDEVKDAQIENALGLFNEHLSARSEQQIKTMLSLGLMKNMKYSKREMGNVGLSESLADVSVSKPKKRLASEEAERILRPWIGG